MDYICIEGKVKARGMTVTSTITLPKFCACFIHAFWCFEFLPSSTFSKHLKSELWVHEIETTFWLVTYYCAIYKQNKVKSYIISQLYYIYVGKNMQILWFFWNNSMLSYQLYLIFH